MKNKLTASKAYPWIVVGLLWVVALLNYMDRQMHDYRVITKAMRKALKKIDNRE